MHRDGCSSRELLKDVSQELLKLIENVSSHFPESLLEVTCAQIAVMGKLPSLH